MMSHTAKASVSIIIPAYNEAASIGGVIETIAGAWPSSEIIVIDDGSDDGTGNIAQNLGAVVYTHPYNIGNGAAIKSGIRIATGDILVFLDGDGQHDPQDIKRLLEHLPRYDMVVGARTPKQQASLGRLLGNRLLNRLASYVTNFAVADLTSGFRAVKSQLAHNFLYLLPNTYSYPTTLTLSVLRSGRSVKYIPITARPRRIGKSNIKFIKDGVQFFMILIKVCTLYSPLRIFLPLSAGTFLLGMGYYIYTFCAWGRFTNMSALLFMTALLTFLMGLVSEQICQMRFERSEGDKPL